MPPPVRDPSDLGNVVNNQGDYRAELFIRELGSAKQIRGPRRGQDKKRAFEDLVAIRNAAVDQPTRLAALQAMSRMAAQLREEAGADSRAGAGSIYAVDGGHRARIKYTDDGDREIKGPRRCNERRATADLEKMRAAAASKTTRRERFEAMQQEAKRLQTEADATPGSVEVFDGGYRARVQYYENDIPGQIRGPRRYDERRARADLDAIYEAGARQATRAERFEAMHKESHRLQAHATYEIQIAMAI